MMTNPSPPLGTHKEKQILFEIGNSEKQLWSLIHSKGLLHSDSQDLYRKVRSSYERTILNNHSHSELQDAEYCLWKLHYKHIDEFRKKIKKCSGNVENNKSIVPQDGVVHINYDNHIKAFSSFLSEAIEFYQTLIIKLRKHYGVPEEALLYEKGWISSSFDPEATMKCQFVCHRCLVCMGDLARYKQQYENLEIQNQNWSVAATYYLEATRIWPDSGNPQNQLAVLATYIGDDFLALYYCVRSLAVKEPFPDAWDNLIFLLEKNRSSDLQYVASEVCFDFFKPSARRTSKELKEQQNDDNSSSNIIEDEINLLTETKLWSLFVRTISFLFIRSSLEEFPTAFASTIGVLDTMMEVDDIELKTILESYAQIDLCRKGPFRALQVVSILIFSLKNLIDVHEKIESNDKKDCQQLVMIHMALSAAFGIMGRFVERCLKATHLKACPLLPSVLVFVEWCASMLDATEVYATDKKCMGAISYFFHVFVELLNQLNDSGKEIKKVPVPDDTPLWEDYELRGFVPVACSHLSLDFSGSWELIDNFGSGTELRTRRMTEAAMKIASRSTNLQKWITLDALGRKFYAARPEEDHKKKETENLVSNDNSARGEEPNHKTHLDTGGNGKISITNGKPFEVEEEDEVILFRPLIRYNSAPPYPTISSDERMSSKDTDHQSLPSYDSMHRAASRLMEQNPSQGEPWGFHGDNVNFRSNKSYKQQEASMKESNEHTISEGVIFAGPPSLSSWVLDRGSLIINNRNMGTHGLISQQRLQLQPIDEAASSYLAGLSINQNENSVMNRPDASSNFPPSSAICYAPVPSAPLLPDNATWFTDVAQSTFPAPLLSNNTSPISGYAGWNSTYGTPGYDPSLSAYSSGFLPQPGRMTSTEWLRRYRENHTLDRINNDMQPSTHLNVPGNHENYAYQYHDTYRFNDALPSNQFTYVEPPGALQLLQPVFPYPYGGATEHNFQRLSSYGCGGGGGGVGGGVTEQRSEAQTLLEYLKEKEWRLQRDPTLRGPTFMGN